MRIWIIIGIILSWGVRGQAQQTELEQVAPYEIKGKWIGKLVQENGGIAPEYYFEMVLEVKDNKITGYSTIEVNNLRGKLSLEGTVDGTQLHIQEIKLTSKDIKTQNASWCIKEMDLSFNFKRGKFRLEGPWKGRSNKFKSKCAPGKIYLKKEAIRA